MGNRIRAALFDLDGVIFDTENQYLGFYGMIGKEYLPEVPDFALQIKGMSLHQIYQTWFDGRPDVQAEITHQLDEFETQMDYNFVRGFESFIQTIRALGIRTAIVTSSNDKKMKNVYAVHPELRSYFDIVLTADDYGMSKPAPDCYLKGVERFGYSPNECIVFEDSINGLRSGKAAGCFVVGLTTTNPRTVVSQYADLIIDDFTHLSSEMLEKEMGLWQEKLG